MTGLGYAYALVFVAFGLFSAGSDIGSMNYLLDLAPFSKRSLYLGFTNTLFGIGIFTTVLGGLIVDLAGFGVLMGISAVLYALAILFSMMMVEPRDGGSPVPK